jgi:hypothetical protein
MSLKTLIAVLTAVLQLATPGYTLAIPSKDTKRVPMLLYTQFRKV